MLDFVHSLLTIDIHSSKVKEYYRFMIIFTFLLVNVLFDRFQIQVNNSLHVKVRKL